MKGIAKDFIKFSKQFRSGVPIKKAPIKKAINLSIQQMAEKYFGGKSGASRGAKFQIRDFGDEQPFVIYMGVLPVVKLSWGDSLTYMRASSPTIAKILDGFKDYVDKVIEKENVRKQEFSAERGVTLPENSIRKIKHTYYAPNMFMGSFIKTLRKSEDSENLNRYLVNLEKIIPKLDLKDDAISAALAMVQSSLGKRQASLSHFFNRVLYADIKRIRRDIETEMGATKGKELTVQPTSDDAKVWELLLNTLENNPLDSDSVELIRYMMKRLFEGGQLLEENARSENNTQHYDDANNFRTFCQDFRTCLNFIQDEHNPTESFHDLYLMVQDKNLFQNSNSFIQRATAISKEKLKSKGQTAIALKQREIKGLMEFFTELRASGQYFSQYPEIITFVKKQNKPNLFTYLQNQDTDLFLKGLYERTKGKEQILRTDDQKGMQSFLSQIYEIKHKILKEIRDRAMKVSIARKPTDLESKFIEVFKESKEDFSEQYNESIGLIIDNLLLQPGIQDQLKNIIGGSNELFALILKYGGKEIPQERVYEEGHVYKNLFSTYLKDLFHYSFRTPSAMQGTEVYNLLATNSFIDSIEDETLQTRFKQGYVWTGLPLSENSMALGHRGLPIELPVGFLNYDSKGGPAIQEDPETKQKGYVPPTGHTVSRRLITGEGQILKMEFDDNFFRISLHSFQTHLRGQNKDAIFDWIQKAKVLQVREGKDISSVLHSDDVNSDIFTVGKSRDEIIKDLAKKLTPDTDPNEIKDYYDLGLHTFTFSKLGTSYCIEQFGKERYYTLDVIKFKGFKYDELVRLEKILSRGDLFKSFMAKEIKKIVQMFDKYIDVCVKKGGQQLAEKLEGSNNPIAVQVKEGWIENPNFYKRHVYAVLDFVIGDYNQFSSFTFYPVWGRYITEKEIDGQTVKFVTPKVKTFFNRMTVNPAFVVLNLLEGTNNAGNDALNMLGQTTKLFSALKKEMNTEFERMGVNVEYEKGKDNFFPVLQEGAIFTEFPRIIDHVQNHYLTSANTEVWGMNFSETVEDEPEDVITFRQRYGKDLQKIVSLLHNIYELNKELVGIYTLNPTTFDPADKGKFTLMKKSGKENLINSLNRVGIQMKTGLSDILTKGYASIKSITTNMDQILEFFETTHGESLKSTKGKEHLMKTIPSTTLQKYKNLGSTAIDKHVEEIGQLIQDAWVNVEDKFTTKSFTPTGSSAATGEEEFYKDRMKKFNDVRDRLRKETSTLLATIAPYEGEKQMFIDSIKSGRVFNYKESEKVREQQQQQNPYKYTKKNTKP